MHTEANVRDASVLTIVNACIIHLWSSLHSGDTAAPEDVSLALEPPIGEEDWSYYFVDHTKRTLFWLEEFTMPMDELQGEPSFAQLRERLLVLGLGSEVIRIQDTKWNIFIGGTYSQHSSELYIN